MLVALTKNLRGNDGDAEDAYFGRSTSNSMGQVVCTFRLVEVKGAGVIGIRMEWRNESNVEETLVIPSKGSPFFIHISTTTMSGNCSGSQKDIPERHIIPLPHAAIGQTLKPGEKVAFFIGLSPLTKGELLVEPSTESAIRVQAIAFIDGKVEKNVDFPMPPIRFQKCLITPQGLSLDAVRLYKQLIRRGAPPQ